MSRSVSQINSDRTLDNKLCEHVEKNSPRIVCLCVRDGEVYLTGEEGTVDILKESSNMPLHEVYDKLKKMNNDDSSKTYVIEKAMPGADQFPLMDFQFKGPSWNYKNARAQLSKYFNFFGFGRSGSKSFNKEEDEPEWFPDEISWSIFKHSTKVTLPIVNTVLKSMFEYFEVDIFSHHTEKVENVSQMKRKRTWRGTKSKKAKSTEFLEDSSEEDIDEAGANTANMNPFYESTEDSDQTDEEFREDMEEEMEKADRDDTVPMKNYNPDDNSDDDSEDEVILNIRAREEKRKKNLEKNKNIESRLREENNL